jgi:cyclic pyranopterin phosphate synthase
MVDISSKNVTIREAEAIGVIIMKPEVLDSVFRGSVPKGDVITAAKLAAISAVKKTAEILPLCHPLPLSHVDAHVEQATEPGHINVRVTVKTTAATGVEMEALTGVTVALLCIYDMCKPLDKEMLIGDIRLLRKTGGKSGNYVRKDDPANR